MQKNCIAVNTKGERVVSRMFDPYRSNVTAPENLLTGLSNNIIESFFMLLPSNEVRARMDLMICAALKNKGLIPQSEIRSGRTESPNSMTLSATYFVLLVCQHKFPAGLRVMSVRVTDLFWFFFFGRGCIDLCQGHFGGRSST